ncbi:hypothetical protein I7I50_05067 [Histoplasma capsulatum G186AR]|uniref:Uncharacterized protein n=1 Tax=Ajellomyces capsulatus TaxID=5037 RepID=A0A8H7ZBR1_AJECA|nr:hypothetical protein I7I52_03325 [Histoplasma capsulatum]QSS75804.1 hypothetical protein I7I50_05067 [Histoplasma capsulatum G186AR]
MWRIRSGVVEADIQLCVENRYIEKMGLGFSTWGTASTCSFDVPHFSETAAAGPDQALCQPLNLKELFMEYTQPSGRRDCVHAPRGRDKKATNHSPRPLVASLTKTRSWDNSARDAGMHIKW